MAHTSASTASHTDTPHEPPLPRRRLLLFSGIFALFMLSANGLVAGTWTYLHGAFPWCGSGLLTLLSLSFLPLMLSGWRIDHPLLQLATRITAASLGLLNFLFFAALACWLALGLSALFGLGWRHALIAELGYALGALIALYAWIEFPFGNPAVSLLFWTCFFGAIRWNRLDHAG